MKHLLSLVLLAGIVLPTGSVLAQDMAIGTMPMAKGEMVEGKVFPLARMNIHTDSCGPYFKFFQSKEDPRSNAFVIAFYDNNRMRVRFVGNEKLDVEVVPGKASPTAHVRVVGGRQDGVALEISPQDFASAPCLKRAMVRFPKQAH